MTPADPYPDDYERDVSREPQEDIDTERARYAISWLLVREEGVELSTWAEHVAAWEEDCPPADVDDHERKQYYSWLHFALVPRLVEEDAVERDGNVVTPLDDARAALGDQFEKVDEPHHPDV